MRKTIILVSIFLITPISAPAFAGTTVINENFITYTDKSTFKEALKNYREARRKAIADTRSAMANYLAERKISSSIKDRNKAWARYKAAKVEAWKLVPKKPVLVTN